MHKHVKVRDIVYVKGEEKTKLAQKWFSRVVRVVEATNAPSFNTMLKAPEETCERHKHNTGLSCARHKTFKLLQYVKIMYFIPKYSLTVCVYYGCD